MAEAGRGAWRRLTAADARRLPWRNGRGTTLELALWPPGATFEAGDFDWRLARAAVDEDGPFSAFPGFDRVLVVLGGAGLLLEHGDRAPAVRAEPLLPCAFAGEWPTRARLLAGRVEDLNLLLRRGVVRGRVALLLPGAHEVPGAGPGHVLAHVLAGTLRASGTGGPARAGETLWLQDPAGGETLVAGEDCTALCVHVTPAGAGG